MLLLLLHKAQRGYYFSIVRVVLHIRLYTNIFFRGTIQMVVTIARFTREHSARLDGAQSVARSSSGRHNDYVYYPPE